MTAKQRKDARQMGDVQKEVLESIYRHKRFNRYGPNGWIWDTNSNTIRVLESLQKRGLVEYLDREHRWVISDLGVEMLKHIRPHLFKEIV